MTSWFQDACMCTFKVDEKETQTLQNLELLEQVDIIIYLQNEQLSWTTEKLLKS